MPKKSQRSQKSQKKDRTTKLIALIVMGIAAIVYVAIEIAAKNDPSLSFNPPTRKTLLETSTFFDYDVDNNSVFHVHRNGIYQISKDGVRYLTLDGQSKYDFAYTMTSAPIYDSSENVIAVTEPKSRNLYVFSSAGSLYTKQMDNIILTFSVNKNGYTSVITQEGNYYRLDVFTDKGVSISSGIFPEYNVFPIATNISEDNRILAVSLVNVSDSDVQINSNVIFTFINQSESINYADGIFANETLENQMVGMIKFGENNNISMISESNITVGRITSEDKYVFVWSKAVDNEIGLIRYNGNKGIAVAYGNSLINKTGLIPGTVELYDFSGNIIFSYETGNKITHLSVSESAIIVGYNRMFTAYNRRGELWTYNATQDVKQLLFLENTNTALFVANNRAVIMKLGKE